MTIVIPENNLQETSRTGRVRLLDIGESYCEVERHALPFSGAIGRSDLTQMQDRLRNLFRPIAARLAPKKYTIETGNFMTNAALVIACVITRIE